MDVDPRPELLTLLIDCLAASALKELQPFGLNGRRMPQVQDEAGVAQAALAVWAATVPCLAGRDGRRPR